MMDATTRNALIRCIITEELIEVTRAGQKRSSPRNERSCRITALKEDGFAGIYYGLSNNPQPIRGEPVAGGGGILCVRIGNTLFRLRGSAPNYMKS